MRSPRQISSLKAALLDLAHRIADLQTIILEDRPRTSPSVAVERLGDDVIELAGWVQEARSALIPATPDGSDVSASTVGTALLGAQQALDRAVLVLATRLTAHEPIAHIRRFCRMEGNAWLAWYRAVESSTTQVAEALNAARQALADGWHGFVDDTGTRCEVSTNGR